MGFLSIDPYRCATSRLMDILHQHGIQWFTLATEHGCRDFPFCSIHSPGHFSGLIYIMAGFNGHSFMTLTSWVLSLHHPWSLFAIGQDDNNSQPPSSTSVVVIVTPSVFSNYKYMLMVIVGIVAHDCKDMKHRSP